MNINLNNQLDPNIIARQVHAALEEDVGTGDLTAALIPINAKSKAVIVCQEHESIVLCGVVWVNEVFRQLDNEFCIEWAAYDGDIIDPGGLVCTLSGNTRIMLSGERTALNFLQTLSATATLARKYVDAVTGTKVRILDTRKTIPGLRLAQKYAVRCGGGTNHRIGLFDAILIKENHIQAAGSIAAALDKVYKNIHELNIETRLEVEIEIEIEIEVESIDELHQALAAGARRILLDNFDLAMLRVAVAENKGQARLEASGNVTLNTIRDIAATGVDDISIGGITKHIQAIDLSMRIINTSWGEQIA